jgi:Plasmid pRiA4b ORF-3-like protein
MLEDFVIAIRLTGVKPRVSRQVQVSGELGLHRFHQVVQAIMGWEDTGPHLWRGSYDDFGDRRQFVPPGPEDERKATVADLFKMIGDTATYVYDFDAQWTLELLLIEFAEPQRFPILLDGTGACPPEGIGGAYVYEEFKRSLKDRSHPIWRSDPEMMRDFQGFNPKKFHIQGAAEQLEQLVSTWRRRSRPKPKVPSRSLIVIDNEPVRRYYRQKLDRVRADLRKLESELERFKGTDTNSFKGWLHATFPVRLSRIRELHEEGARLINRLNLMRLFQQHGVKTPGQAYRRAVRVEAGEDPMPDFPPSRMPERTGGQDEERQILRTAMKSLAEDMGIDADSVDDEVDAMLDGEFGEKQERTADRRECQSIYRQIALRLHPDRGGPMTETEAQIWYRAQEAYAAGDVLTLKQLWSHIANSNEFVSELSCSEMVSSLIETQAQIEALRMLRNSLKREPAWNFSRLTDKQLRSRHLRVEKDLTAQEESIRRELDDLHAECSRLSVLQQRWESKHHRAAEQINLF